MFFFSTVNLNAAKQDVNDAYVEKIESEEKEYKVKLSYLDVLNEYYMEYVQYSKKSIPKIEIMTFDEFKEYFYNQDTFTISDYLDYLKEVIDSFELSNNEFKEYINDEETLELYSSSSSSKRAWYYDTGTSLPQKPNYGKFDFSSVWTGDILYEDAGFGGLTGHIAIIEGNFYDSTYDMNYWRLMEAVDPGGGCRGVLDDDRFVDRKGYLLYVPSSSAEQTQKALYFVTKQLGKPLSLQPFTKPTSIDHPRWQCSTLVWAAYNYAGIDIEQHGLGGGPGITPHDVRDASTTSQYLSYKSA